VTLHRRRSRRYVVSPVPGSAPRAARNPLHAMPAGTTQPISQGRAAGVIAAATRGHQIRHLVAAAEDLRHQMVDGRRGPAAPVALAALPRENSLPQRPPARRLDPSRHAPSLTPRMQVPLVLGPQKIADRPGSCDPPGPGADSTGGSDPARGFRGGVSGRGLQRTVINSWRSAEIRALPVRALPVARGLAQTAERPEGRKQSPHCGLLVFPPRPHPIMWARAEVAAGGPPSIRGERTG
jgi:hypothetical protein